MTDDLLTCAQVILDAPAPVVHIIAHRLQRHVEPGNHLPLTPLSYRMSLLMNAYDLDAATLSALRHRLDDPHVLLLAAQARLREAEADGFDPRASLGMLRVLAALNVAG